MSDESQLGRTTSGVPITEKLIERLGRKAEAGYPIPEARVNLVVLRCGDIEVTRRFYELLGFRFTEHRHGDGPRHYANEGAVTFELYGSSGEPDRTGVGAAVTELHAVHRRLTDAGHTPAEVQVQPWGKTFVVKDPDGRRVEVQADGDPSSAAD